MVWEMNILTIEEEAEFTPLNAVAYDLYRKNCQEKDMIPVCWLCISNQAKDEARDALYEWLGKEVPRTQPYTYETASKLINKIETDDMINLWKAAENKYKQYRLDGNPKAYFAK